MEPMSSESSPSAEIREYSRDEVATVAREDGLVPEAHECDTRSEPSTVADGLDDWGKRDTTLVDVVLAFATGDHATVCGV